MSLEVFKVWSVQHFTVGELFCFLLSHPDFNISLCLCKSWSSPEFFPLGPGWATVWPVCFYLYFFLLLLFYTWMLDPYLAHMVIFQILDLLDQIVLAVVSSWRSLTPEWEEHTSCLSAVMSVSDSGSSVNVLLGYNIWISTELCRWILGLE